MIKKKKTFNPSTQEAEADGSLNSKPYSTSLGQQGLHRETLSHKTKEVTEVFKWEKVKCIY